jgi:hypothetical protein
MLRYVRKLLLALVVSAALVGIVAVGYIAFLVLASQGPGWFHRSRFEAVVAEVRRLPLPVDEVVELYLDDISNARSLRPMDEASMESGKRGKRAGRVWAKRTASGHLKVVIETKDSGHAGEFGFAFSDLPLGPIRRTEYPEVSVPGYLYYVEGPQSQIDEHWWRVYNNDF